MDSVSNISKIIPVRIVNPTDKVIRRYKETSFPNLPKDCKFYRNDEHGLAKEEGKGDIIDLLC